MENKKWIRFVESFILLPALTISSVPVGSISQATINIVNTPLFASLQKQNIKTPDLLAANNAVGLEIVTLQVKAYAIDSYFGAREMPLKGVGMKMVLEAKRNNLDWRLLPAIAVRESTGGKFACKTVNYNPFGWGSCKIGFNSNDEAIETVARNLGGNNPKTAYHYDEKTTKQILRAYNPPSIVPRYAEQVMSIMKDIGAEDITPTVTATT
ncbi:MAG: hypothetical protein US45_C0049G0002 [Candidatus Nomurabacteria bacterium GW2011_GWA1_37_20]|uniref:Mannosyl-glycoprotein endo-beta-N-acetylglucosamidase-like domain-containing protein n=2 Tax=Parcubacteria group TaxID=1794811 RepID=A0A0G0HUS3_9BACT|nr:MAG: hypothetical protein US33_C0030G0008 [Parcubacteria group bacterium GW2011_GWC1_36_9]KKQ30117.1 MAG: hypothetical protein US45_C0049G0002 [Candidatus Nomurabacteria bacterium GW2011_GWA1_37_20]KKQ46908.1 MAG: hypothetical protein US65_C0023G0010 [Candidatus Yanofskybacteria bacterium GW2011_GWC2_37_9]